MCAHACFNVGNSGASLFWQRLEGHLLPSRVNYEQQQQKGAPHCHYRLGRPVLVLDGGLRYGCVNLQVDIYQLRQRPGSRDAGQGQQGAHHIPDADQAQQQAQDVLMECIPEEVARLMSSAQLTEHMDAGTIMTVQVPLRTLVIWFSTALLFMILSGALLKEGLV